VAADHTTAVFIAELILLLFFGRVLGEGMSRVGSRPSSDSCWPGFFWVPRSSAP
jgi:hypothetical protein